MNKEELTALVAEILRGNEAPAAKKAEPERVAADVSNMDLRKLYMVKDAAGGDDLPAAFVMKRIVRIFPKFMQNSIDKSWWKVYHNRGLANANP